MSIETLILYGSRARGDQDEMSDVDLFAITNSGAYSMIVKNKTNLAAYPFELASQMAENGDIFLLHILEEGKVIYDSGSKFETLKSNFRYKETYEEEIKNASDLGWLIVRHASQATNITLINRRIAWCVRTVLIAKSVEQRYPRFAATALAEFAKDSNVIGLIKIKNENSLSNSILRVFEQFLRTHGTPPPQWLNGGSISSYLSELTRTNNIVGIKTANALMTAAEDFGY